MISLLGVSNTHKCVCVYAYAQYVQNEKKTNPNNKTLSGLPKTMFFDLRLLNLILSIKLHLEKTLNYYNHKMECSQLCLAMLGAALPKEQSRASVCPYRDPKAIHTNFISLLHTKQTLHPSHGERQGQCTGTSTPASLFHTQLVQVDNCPHSRLVLQYGYHYCCLDFKDKNPEEEE